MIYNYNYTNNNQQYVNINNMNNYNQLNQINMKPYNICNNVCNGNINYYTQYQYNSNNNFQPIAKIKSNKKKNKSVKFNDKVNIINVQSFKEYNKIDGDDVNIEYSYNDVNDKKIKIDKKKADNCECIII